MKTDLALCLWVYWDDFFRRINELAVIEMKDRFKHCQDRIQIIKNQLKAIDFLGIQHTIKISTGEEELVTFDIKEMFKRHQYHIYRMIYHAENFINSYLNYNVFPSNQNINSEYKTTWNNNITFYEFDSFIATGATLFEEPFKKDAQECFDKKLFQKFESIFPTKNSPDSIVWRLTIIRNRVVHPDNAVTSKSGFRYKEFSSKLGGMAKIKDGIVVEIQAHLVDIAHYNDLKKILNEEVIEKTKEVKKSFKKRECNHNCMPLLPDFHSIMFNKIGKAQKGANMMITKGTNLLESFLGICHEILNYLFQINKLYFEYYLELLHDSEELDYACFLDKNDDIFSYGKVSESETRNYILIKELFNYS